MIKLLDIGARFGFDVYDIFGLNLSDVLIPASLLEAAEMLQVCNLVAFGGGNDICPGVYGHENVASFSGAEPSHRDLFEIAVWNEATKLGIPKLGICRGAQLVCALSGGWLIQHVAGHAGGEHLLETVKGMDIPMTSAHHQMMYPFSVPHELIAWFTPNPEHTYNYKWDRTSVKEKFILEKHPEVVYFPDTVALAVQGHPEYYPPNHPTNEWVRGLVFDYLGVK